jgi:hypothetical protein
MGDGAAVCVSGEGCRVAYIDQLSVVALTALNLLQNQYTLREPFKRQLNIAVDIICVMLYYDSIALAAFGLGAPCHRRNFGKPKSEVSSHG